MMIMILLVRREQYNSSSLVARDHNNTRMKRYEESIHSDETVLLSYYSRAEELRGEETTKRRDETKMANAK
jgi:hypothetical protein